jgi:hypothetical protein
MSAALAVVAYRNPIEEWFWESGVAYWIILGLCALVVTVAGYLWVIDRKGGRK